MKRSPEGSSANQAGSQRLWQAGTWCALCWFSLPTRGHSILAEQCSHAEDAEPWPEVATECSQERVCMCLSQFLQQAPGHLLHPLWGNRECYQLPPSERPCQACFLTYLQSLLQGIPSLFPRRETPGCTPRPILSSPEQAAARPFEEGPWGRAQWEQQANESG